MQQVLGMAAVGRTRYAAMVAAHQAGLPEAGLRLA